MYVTIVMDNFSESCSAIKTLNNPYHIIILCLKRANNHTCIFIKQYIYLYYFIYMYI